MIRQLLAVTVLAAAMALGTWWLGWWVVPILGAAWGAARYAAYPSMTAGVAAALGWLLLVGVAALRGPMGEVSRTLAGALSVPGWVPLLVTGLFPAALAAAGARFARCVLPMLEGERAGAGTAGTAHTTDTEPA
jgi:hypothetical protein